MSIFKCPYCVAEYELTMAHLSFQQRSYANCQVCHRTMYSWSSRNVPRFTLMNPPEVKHRLIHTSATTDRGNRGYTIFWIGDTVKQQSAPRWAFACANPARVQSVDSDRSK